MIGVLLVLLFRVHTGDKKQLEITEPAYGDAYRTTIGDLKNGYGRLHIQQPA